MRAIIDKAVLKIKNKINVIPDVAVILGSGLGELAEQVKEKIEFLYSELGLCASTVGGHCGKMIFGKFENKNVCFMQGRVHLYEGYNAKEIVLPIYVLKQLGVNNLILTNASGGINKDFNAGDIVLIDDVINLTGQNPLIGGAIIDYGEYFIDMNNLFVLNKKVKGLKSGVYAQLLGPTYETQAEINMLSKIGADMVGMSTVIEVIAGRQCKMNMACLSLIANSTGNAHEGKLSHKEVLETAEKSADIFKNIVKNLINSI